MANGIKVVCSSRHTPRLQKLHKMSLYDNMLSNVKVRRAWKVLWEREHSVGFGVCAHESRFVLLAVSTALCI